MRIAQVCPLYESCPPRLYGGTERVVSYLTEEPIRQAHEVTLFASADSETKAIAVILIGGKLNAEIERQTAQDSTEAAPEPIGARRAKMADTVGPARS